MLPNYLECCIMLMTKCNTAICHYALRKMIMTNDNIQVISYFEKYLAAVNDYKLYNKVHELIELVGYALGNDVFVYHVDTFPIYCANALDNKTKVNFIVSIPYDCETDGNLLFTRLSSYSQFTTIIDDNHSSRIACYSSVDNHTIKFLFDLTLGQITIQVIVNQ